MPHRFSTLIVTSLISLLAVTHNYAASELTFDASAKPTTLVLGDTDRFASHSSSGFHIRHFDGKEITDTLLSNISTSGNEITVQHPDGLPSFTFRIDTYDKHLAIHLIDTEGIAPDDRNWGINLTLRANADVGHFSLNDLADSTGVTNPYGVGTSLKLEWRYLWGTRYDGARGSFVLYDGTLTGAALDATLAEIWSTQNAAGHMVRPAGHSTWTEADVMNWVTAYAAQNNGMSGIQMEASTPTELYNLTDNYVIPNNVKRVYLHTKTWRGEYWPNYFSRVNVNTDVFPAGKADLLAYADYLRANGVLLRLHNVSCGIGKNDPDYIVGGVDPRLASWGAGTLEEAIDDTADVIRFRPSLGLSLPLLDRNFSQPGGILYYNYIRIGDEIVRIGSFRQTDDEVWLLENCQRGHGGTDPAPHVADKEVVGIHASYGVNYIPAYDLDQPNSLMDELALEYATFVNDIGLGHLHFDGPEIHDIHHWVGRDLFDRIYSYVDHPTTSSRVGRSIAAHFEQQFSVIRDDGSYAYFPLEVGIRLEYLNRPKLATSILDTHFHIADGILLGGRRVTLSVVQSGLGVNEDVLTTHGLSSDVLDIFQYWLELAPALDPADVAYLDGMLTKVGGHYEGEDVPVLSKDTNDDYIFTPHRVMGRSSGVDDPISIEQEWGTVPRLQEITAGTTMTLSNPYTAQEPQVIIRVVETSTTLEDPLITLNGAGTLAVAGDVQPGEYLQFAGGSSVTVFDNNWKLDRTLPAVATNFSVVNGDNTVTTAAGSGSNTSELMVQYITKGSAYVLQTNNHL